MIRSPFAAGVPVLLLAAWLFSGEAGRTTAAAPPAKSRHPAPAAHHGNDRRRAALTTFFRPAEIVEMLWALANGSNMGPGEGWFHEGQSCYGWDWLATRYDADHDGKITTKEFAGPADLFDRLDRDGDGVLTRADFDWSEKSPLARQAAAGQMCLRLIDTNSNGRISRGEWAAFFEKASRGKGFLTPEDFQEAMRAQNARQAKEKTTEEPSPWVFLHGLWTGELGSFNEGPTLGRRAPDFTLKTQDGKRVIRLADYRGKKPVVLVFGSFT